VLLDDIVERLAPQSGSPDAVLRRRAQMVRRFGGPVHPTVAAIACDAEVIVWQTSHRGARGHTGWWLLDWEGREYAQLLISRTAHLSSVGHGRLIATAYELETFSPYLEVYALPSPR
jgi:hypothetical protein